MFTTKAMQTVIKSLCKEWKRIHVHINCQRKEKGKKNNNHSLQNSIQTKRIFFFDRKEKNICVIFVSGLFQWFVRLTQDDSDRKTTARDNWHGFNQSHYRKQENERKETRNDITFHSRERDAAEFSPSFMLPNVFSITVYFPGKNTKWQDVKLETTASRVQIFREYFFEAKAAILWL